MKIHPKGNWRNYLAIIALTHWKDLTASEYNVLPTVTVNGNHIGYVNPTWYSPEYLSSATSGGGGSGGIGAGAAMMAAKERAWDLSKVCIAPVSEQAKKTTHN